MDFIGWRLPGAQYGAKGDQVSIVFLEPYESVTHLAASELLLVMTTKTTWPVDIQDAVDGSGKIWLGKGRFIWIQNVGWF